MKKVGDILRRKRKSKGFTLDDVYKETKVHPKFIKALEQGDYSIFSNRVHAKGFLKNYARFLELDLNEVLAFWRREYEAYFEKLEEQSNNKKIYTVDTPGFVFSPSVFVIGSVFILIFLFFGYLFYQYRNYSSAPVLEVYSPVDNSVVDDDVVDITGETELDTEVFLNNQSLNLNPDGSFATSIKLNRGINTLSFRAINSLGRETELIRTVVLRRENGQVPESTPSVDPGSESNPDQILDSSGNIENTTIQ